MAAEHSGNKETQIEQVIDVNDRKITLLVPPHLAVESQYTSETPTLAVPQNSHKKANCMYIDWDPLLRENETMYRDDHGGWVSREESRFFKIVGKDYRGLPIVHRGKGRPNRVIADLLAQQPIDITNSQPAQPVHTEIDGQEFVVMLGRPDSDLLDTSNTICDEKTVSMDDANLDAVRDVTLEIEVEMITDDSITSHSTDTGVDDQGKKLNIKWHRCLECPSVFRSSLLLRRHQSSPQCTGFSTRCCLCHIKIEDDFTLYQHETSECIQRIIEHGVVKPGAADWSHWHLERYRCSICGGKFADESAVLKHSREEHPGRPPFQCKLCDCSYYEIRALNNHYRAKHDSHSLVCDFCNKQFSHARGLKLHLTTAHKENGESYKCEHCNKELGSAKSLRSHISVIHDNHRPFTCAHCSKGFSSQTILDTHIKIHFNQRDFVCEYCGAAFYQKVRLIEHVKAHLNMRDWQCAECERKFLTKKDLVCHIRTHSNDRPFKCKICDKTFNQSQTLRKHEQIHQPQVQITCKYCNRVLPNSRMKKHVRQCHSEELVAKCSSCKLSYETESELQKHIQTKHLQLTPIRLTTSTTDLSNTTTQYQVESQLEESQEELAEYDDMIVVSPDLLLDQVSDSIDNVDNVVIVTTT